MLLILLSTYISACGVQSGEEQVSQTGSGSEAKTVIDSLGRKVEVPEKVDRIGCLYASSGHVVTMLGQADGIVAVVNVESGNDFSQ